MKLLEALNSVFLECAGATGYFKDPAWKAVAFDRNAYDNTRMPEWFFRAASDEAQRLGDFRLIIADDAAVSGAVEVHVLPFEWGSYSSYMLGKGASSVEYRMASENLLCGCWADPDITVFGGSPALMHSVFQALGGEDVLLNRMRQEFFHGDVQSYGEMDRFLRCLLTGGIDYELPSGA